MSNAAKRNKRGTKKAMERKRPAPAVAGLTQSEATALEDFFSAMKEEVVPEIVRDEEERRVLAAESRRWPLKTI